MAFYSAALGALGFGCVWRNARGAGFGVPGGQDRLALFLVEAVQAPGPGFHLAFDAPSQLAVDDFHGQSIQFGGRDLGSPGLRPQYGPDYYAAFVLDPDGYKIEAVHQTRSG